MPLYRLIDVKSGSLLQLLRALAFQAQNVDPVEDSPDFVDALRAATAGARGVLFTDGEGGSLEATPVRPLGQVSRALIAAYVLLSETGYKGTVVHLNGGANPARGDSCLCSLQLSSAHAFCCLCARAERVVRGGPAGRGRRGGVGVHGKDARGGAVPCRAGEAAIV